jgi:ribosomal protein S18 acetylase RimI-like enzyme
MLTQEVIKRATARNIPVYIESTKTAVKMYEKLGFTKLGEISIEIPGQGKDTGINEVYEEVCMIRKHLSS